MRKQCWACDGSGKETYSNGTFDCGMCNGSGEIEEWVHAGSELNVANSNAAAIVNMLGGPSEGDDWCGVWTKEDLPKIRRQLILLKNKGSAQHVEEPYEAPRKMGVSKDENGLDRIAPQGPRMVYGGRSQEQIDRYIDRLLAIIDFAQKNDAVVSWG